MKRKSIAIEDYKVVTRLPVQWGDMDAFQHVNNVVYLRWVESSRIDYFDQIGVITSLKDARIGPILGWQECKYIFPMVFPDVAIVGTRTLEILEDRFVLESVIFSERYSRLACLAKQHIVPYDFKALKKATMPQEWIDAIDTLESSNSPL